MKVIILNCYSRNSLAVINALAPTCTLIGGDTAKDKYVFGCPDKLFKSGKLSGVFRHPSPKKDFKRFINDIVRRCREHQADVIIASGTTMSNFLSMAKPRIEAETSTKIPMEGWDRLSKLFDKWETIQLCRELEIPVPRSELVTPATSLDKIVSTFKFPVIAKPRSSFASKGVMRFKTAEEMMTSPLVNDQSLADAGYIVQELIDGELHDVTSCSVAGKPVALMSQVRLMTLYDFGGGGIVNKTTRYPQIMDYATRIIRRMKWNGILEVDFIRSHNGLFHLLECNPKIWGTAELSVKAGLNMPKMLIDHLVMDNPPVPPPEYEEGLLYKWFFPECVYHWVTKPRNPSRILCRVANTLKLYGAKRAITSLRLENIPHLLGIVMNKSEL